jgi:UDP-GlcNAc3NAcA epimerase
MIASFGDTLFISRFKANPLLIQLPPVGYPDMLLLEMNSRIILTDSGGVQKESYFFRKPCIVLRPETEWTELVEHKAALLADADQQKILDYFHHFHSSPPKNFPPLYGNGHAAEYICSRIVDYCG